MSSESNFTVDVMLCFPFMYVRRWTGTHNLNSRADVDIQGITVLFWLKVGTQ